MAKNILVTAGPEPERPLPWYDAFCIWSTAARSLPQHAYLITFTNKAAEEIAQRLTDAIGEKAVAVFVGTFHQFCLLWLRREQQELRVIGPSERAVLLRRLFPDASPFERRDMAEQVNAFFRSCPETGQTVPPAVPVRRYLEATRERWHARSGRHYPLLSRSAVKRCRFCQPSPAAVERPSGRRISGCQSGPIPTGLPARPAGDNLCHRRPRSGHLWFQGQQSRAFPKIRRPIACRRAGNPRHPSPQLSKRRRDSFGSPRLIGNNSGPGNENCTPLRQQKARLEYLLAASPKAEAQYIVQRIEEAAGGISHFSIDSGRGGSQGRGISFSDFAVLIRLNTQARAIRDALEKRGIPCQLVGLPPFFMEKDCRLASFWILALAELAAIGDYLQLFADLPGVGHGSLDKLEDFALKGGDFFDSSRLAPLLPGQSRPALDGFLERLKICRASIGEADVQQLAETGIRILGLATESDDAKRFLRLAGSFGSDLPAFARHLQRNAVATVYDDRAEAVSLMTIHGCQGPGIRHHLHCRFGRRNIAPQFQRQKLRHGRGAQTAVRGDYPGPAAVDSHLLPAASAVRQSGAAFAPPGFIDELPQDGLQVGHSGSPKPGNKPAKQLSLF